MSIDVVYQGLPIAKEARVHFEDGGLFVEVEAPMPVATQLTLSHSDKTATSTFLGRVRRIRESASPGTTPPAGHTAGMLIVPVEAEKLPRWLMPLHPDTVGAAEFQPEAAPPPPPPTTSVAQEAAPSAASPEPHAEATHDTDADDKKHASSGAGSKKKKSKRR